MKSIKLFLASLCVVLGISAYAQNVTVSGMISDASNGEPIPFASVQVKGTTQGTSADADGHYTISLPKNGTLIISSIGYINQEIAVAGNLVINVALHPDAVSLDNVVVVAYGTAKKGFPYRCVNLSGTENHGETS